ncbi:hypothetical protein OG728_37815 [Streptomyces microflavus]|uniref:hypothetical protein n=1 Tax=Streptomyces microflavus TaxID=1919 RepID=UPI002E15CF2D|nr:hypothetical protein OG728_00230 [Streptomyces microflavus]WSR96276.1 hypothetical protein OG728_37815 [Streptomyces microflavus]
MYDFPQDLRDAQIALHQAQSEYARYARGLPWSAESMAGWEGDKQLHSGYRSSKPDSPGYTGEQHRQVAAFRARLLELGTLVITHPYWQTLSGTDVFTARMQLKYADDRPDAPGAGPVGEAA